MLIILFNKLEVVRTIMMTLNCQVRDPTEKYYFSCSCSISSSEEVEPQHPMIFQADAEGEAFMSHLLYLLLIMILFCLSWMSNSIDVISYSFQLCDFIFKDLCTRLMTTSWTLQLFNQSLLPSMLLMTMLSIM